ncbi:MFS transporter [Aerococcus kribbianus]|uniref:MFS transporter n=1 Tax=Aerococcus kribbianus TaxID=2999064 RepID=A0A9X3JG75_9LACT|nr:MULTISPECIES: MFS transporter [unclassified Aerococcus]MCZ0716946.1 MFS transporter [Aerococcus sp. YH-aer221]MCZ0725234.1 MFS transporter [Aerococcus sp. YH-aer222]
MAEKDLRMGNTNKVPNPPLEDDNKSYLTAKHKIGYLSGDAGGVATLVMVTTYMNRYITNILGISFSTLSILLLIWNAWDMINDPMMGIFMDKSFAKSSNHKDKFRPWILRSIPLIVLGLIALFSVPSLFDGMIQIVALFLVKIVYELGYTMMNIAMGSILGVMALNDTERTTLSSARGMGSTLGNLVAAMIIPIILSNLGENAMGYAVAGTFAAILGGILVYIHYWGTEERNVKAKLAAEEQSEPAKITDIFDTVKKNRAFMSLCLHSIVIVFGQTMYNTTMPYIYGDVFNDIGLMSTASAIGLGIPVVLLLISPYLVRLIGTTVKLIQSYLLIATAIFIGLYIWQLSATIVPIVYAVLVSIAFAIMMMSVQLQWGLVSEAIDYNEYITGKRSEGSIYGNFSLTRRIGQMLAQSLVVLMIGWIGYSQSAANAGQPQSEMAQSGLIILNLLGPAVCAFFSFLSFKFLWNIDDKTRTDMALARKARLDD